MSRSQGRSYVCSGCLFMFAPSAHLACGSFCGNRVGPWPKASHGDDASVSIPNIMNLQQRKVATKAHAGLCGVHHVDCIAPITLESLLRYVL